jgi:zinc transport system ATP-binding protein
LKIIEVENLRSRYNGIHVLDDITFSVSGGDYIGLVGPNGSGKTTLIKNILGILRPESGQVRLFGQYLSEFQEWFRVGYLPQRLSSLNPGFPSTVEEIVALGLVARRQMPGYSGEAYRDAVEKALRLLNISDIRRKKIGELSGGQQQRVLIARAIINEPDLIILDEPAAALDPETREQFYAMLTHFNRRKNATIILVTHDIGSIGQYANKLLLVDRRVVFYGSFADFCSSAHMTDLFGVHSQHVICHRHES